MLTDRKKPGSAAAFVLAAVLALAPVSGAFAESAGQYVDDAAITAKVKAALLADKQVEGTDVKVETTKGVVELSGAVNSKTQEDQALKIAKGIDGVKSVTDMITVRD